MTEFCTPRRVYFKDNVCVICGFCFVVSETDSSGNTVLRKFTNVKLRLTDERLKNIGQVVGSLENCDIVKNGVCVRCYRSVEKVLKLLSDANILQKQLKETNCKNSLILPSPRRMHIEKRLLRSPSSCQPQKIMGMRFPKIAPVVPIKLQDFSTLSAAQSVPAESILKMVHPQTCAGQQLHMPVVAETTSHVPSQQLHVPVGTAMMSRGSLSVDSSQQPARRSLFSREETDASGKMQVHLQTCTAQQLQLPVAMGTFSHGTSQQLNIPVATEMTSRGSVPVDSSQQPARRSLFSREETDASCKMQVHLQTCTAQQLQLPVAMGTFSHGTSQQLNIPVATEMTSRGSLPVDSSQQPARRSLFSREETDASGKMQTSNDKNKSYRKRKHHSIPSELFDDDENIIIQTTGSVLAVIAHFPSGSKSRWITDDVHKKYCKVLFRDKEVEEGLLKVMISNKPDSVLSAAAELINSECEEICKRNSGSILRDKSHENMSFSWDKFHSELQLRAPGFFRTFSAAVVGVPKSLSDPKLQHVLLAAAICLQGRNREMTTLQYLIGFVMLHGSCTQRDIERLSKIGLSVHPQTLRKKVDSWHDLLDRQLLEIKSKWECGLPTPKYQLVGDNWDRNIVPSYRTTLQKTTSIHLFNVIGVVDRVVPPPADDDYMYILDVDDLEATDFIPSPEEMDVLEKELTFLVANSVINNIEQMNGLLRNIFPDHYEHTYSHLSGSKTDQFCLGLFDCDEKKTGDVIKLLKNLSAKYVPVQDEDVYEPVFFGGDRLTDERIQIAQASMVNCEKSIDRFEGFISKIEDFHRLMNFLEAIAKVTYSTDSGRDPGTAYYFRNKLNAREVKAELKNAYRPYKLLFYTILDAICCLLFLKEFGLDDMSQEIPVPINFSTLDSESKITWMTERCTRIVRKWFFDDDLLSEVRSVLKDPDHLENYWAKSYRDGRFGCHFCEKTYANVDSLIIHEKNKHGHKCSSKETPTDEEDRDDLFNYIVLLFRLCILHKNLDSAVDMGDGARSVRSAKYETLLYNKTGKTKYLIGSIHLTSLTSGTLSRDQTIRLVQNRFINVSGGKNRNMALDEYVEILNREIKNASSGFQTKESLVKNSKDFPFLVSSVHHFDEMCDIRGRKGFHHIPSYSEDVKIVLNDLISLKALEKQPGRHFHCKRLSQSRNPFSMSFKNLPLMILRHRPSLPFRRLRNRRV